MRRKAEIRKSAFKRGYTKRWDKARLVFLAKHPSCINVGKPGCTGTATCVDHIIDHKCNSVLFWDRKNWQPMCHHCHSSKTAKQQCRTPSTPRYDVHGNPTEADHHWRNEA
jgi:5-methylcytosine-specific restriction protein A